MTLKTRNRLYLFFAIASAAALVLCGIIFTLAAISSNIVPPQDAVRTVKLFGGKNIFDQNFYAVITNIFLLTAYVPVVAFIVYQSFEKTQSLEVIYFAGFLLGVLAESLRIFVPVAGLWRGFSSLLLLSGQGVISGRILCSLSLLSAALFSENDQRKNIERNLMGIIVCSVFAGVIFPFDTSQTSSTCMVLWSFRPLLTTLRVLIFLATISVLIINGVSKGSREMFLMALGYALLFTGYTILCATDCFMLTGAGTALLAVGTSFYLKSTHRIYMWH